MAPPLSLQAKRWRVIIVTVPIIGATSLVLYQRLSLGTPQRTLARPPPVSPSPESQAPRPDNEKEKTEKMR